MKQNYMRSLVVVMLLGFISVNALSVIRYVKPNDVSNAWQSKSNVYSDLQLALADAVNGDEIWVAEGVYKPTTSADRTFSFELKAGVKLYGGFIGTETTREERDWYLNKTILSGDIGASGDNSDNSYTVVKAIGSEIFVINKNNVFDGFVVTGGNNQQYGWIIGSGGGMICDDASPLVSNVVFENNRADNNGAGVYCNEGANATFVNCLFISNTSYMGAGAYLYKEGSFYNCLWYNNTFDNSGVNWSTSDEGLGVDLYKYSSGQSAVVNSVFVLTSHNSGQYAPVKGLTEINNIKSADPGFVSLIDGDFRLLTSSIVIDKGDNSYLQGLETDFYGNPRVQNDIVDVGPIEGGIVAPVTVAPVNLERIKAVGGTATVYFKGKWEQSPTYSIRRYFIQYWRDLSDITSADISSDLTYSTSFAEGQTISWRLGVELVDGTINYSSISTFSLPHNRPFYVKEGESGDGSSWANAFGGLKEALDSAVDGDQIWVAEGTYYPTITSDRNISFEIKRSIEIYGGFNGTESKLEERDSYKNKTILNGDIGQVDNQGDNSKNIMVIDATGHVIVDGLQIINGNASDWRGRGQNGAALTINGGTQQISNVLFKNNNVSNDGGAVYINNGESYIANCIFKNNESINGGALFKRAGNCKIVNSVFDNNKARQTSAVYGADAVSNSVFINNYSKYRYIECSSYILNYNRLSSDYGGDNNIIDEITFVAADLDDYRLVSGSAGINVGCNDSIPAWITKDYSGSARIQDDVVDLGAFEGSVICPIVVSPADGHVIKTSEESLSVELKGGWADAADYSISKYIIEYWENGGDVIQLEVTSDFGTTIDFTARKEYSWRVGVVTETGVINYSAINTLSIAASTPYYVKSGSAGDGSSWTSAFGTINEALNVAVNGDEIWVAKGTYYATDKNDRNSSFAITTGISVYGGFVGNETSIEQRDWRLNKTIISGNIGDENEDVDNTSCLINYNNTTNTIATFDGLIICDAFCYDEGGGLRILNGTATVVNCIFENNWAYDGPAIYNERGLLNCYNTIFRSNKADWNYILKSYNGQQHISNCVFVKNEANYIIYGKGLIANSIIWGNNCNRSSIITIKASYCCIENETVNTNNINVDPIFMDMDGGDYRLHYLSPCIDAGNKEALPTNIGNDYFGNIRVVNEQLDMGICEGGVITPLAKTPKDDEIVKIATESSYILLKWEWESTIEKPEVESYTIEYWINEGTMKTVETVNEFATIVAGSGSEVKWRVVSNIVGEGSLNGLINTFYIPHLHPIYVKEGATGDGTSWESAFGDLQEAMQNAKEGDELWIAAGTYRPAESDRFKSFELKKGFKLYGGFSGTETQLSERNWRNSITILSGNINDLTSKTDNTTHLMECKLGRTDSVWVDGVMLKEACANYWSNDQQIGAAIYATGGVLFVNNVWIKDNSSDEAGSALYNKGADIWLTNSVISHNKSAYNNGCTVFHEEGKTQLINSVVTNNEGKFSGGICCYDVERGLEAVNSIICNNRGINGNDNVYGAKVRYSLISDAYSGDGNIVGDPLFVDEENGDYRVNVLSPAINAGNNDSIPAGITTDMAGNNRIVDNVVDMGCFEGGVIMPNAIRPVNQEIIKGVFLGTEITFEWSLPEGFADPGFESYRLEYWTDVDDKTIVADLTEMSYTASLSNGNEYQWQVIAIVDGEEVPSQVMSFSLTHYYAIKVKEGATGYGDRWNYAFGNLQDAIDEAVSGDEIWIAAGTYYPSKTDDRTESFEINKQLKIYGGFKGSEVYLTDRKLNPALTVLSGDIGSPDVITDNTHRIIDVVLQDADTLIIDGLTICDGVAEGSHNYGQVAGLNSKGGYIELNNLVVRDNTSESVGAGVYTRSTMRINNSLLTRNISRNNSGAVGAYECEVYVNNSTIVDNEAAFDGGGLNSNSRGVFYVSNSIIWSNGERNVSAYYGSEFAHSCIEGMGFAKTIINEDPLFVDAENGNYRLQPSSPAINVGINDSIPEGVRYDLDGIGRVSWGVTDMGAYEASYPKTVRPADKTPERPSGVLGYTWTLGADMDGVTPDPNLMDATEYKMSFKSWDIDDEAKVYEEVNNLGYWGMLSFNFDYRQGYKWKVGVQTDAYTYWSDTSTFYIGGEAPLYVKEGSTGNGSSWNNAFGTIKEALDAAIKGDEIWIANGTYNVTSDSNREATLNLSSYLALYGGFNGTEAQRYERFNSNGHTIISGDIGAKNDASDNTKHIISMGGTAEQTIDGVVIDGLTISDANSGNENGGAIQAKYASYKVLNCYLSDNTSAEGAAVYNESADIYLYNSQVDNNTSATAVIYGDASSRLQLVNNTVTANSAGVAGVGSVANTIVYGNQGTSLSGVTASYSCIEGGYEGENIVTGNPDFQNSEERNYRLGKYSSCFDQGSDSYLPTNAYMDLYKNERRTFYSQVDIGAFEVGFDQLGKVEPISYTPEDGAVDVDYESSISMLFNQAVEVDLKAIVMTPQKVYWGTGMNQDYRELSLYHSADLVFGETYTIEIPAEAITFKYNNKIPTTGVKFSFTIRDCKPAIISFEADNVELCLFDDVEIPVTLAGDYLRGYKWMKADTLFQESYYLTELQINKFTDKYKGAYTMAVEDVCGNTITKDLSLNLKETTPIVIKDKWDDVVFVDNSAQNFSDFNWYLDGSQVETRQYLDLAKLTGEVHVTAIDAGSGCTVYSDTLTVSGGGLKAMTVHPNPVQQNEVLHIKLPMQQDKAVVRLFDIVGNLVAQDDYENTVIIDYDKTNLKPGVYILEVDANGLVEQRKIIIQK